ncbi:MAG: calcium/sodium antiporter [Acidobacteriota bacterium]|nr:calcium/sodium antiporter [Acidobacteriota bacterium]
MVALHLYTVWIHSLYLLVALALMARGGDLFVDASSQLSRVLRIPRIVIGGTIVSIATTVPELLTSVQASLRGDTGMALGNAVGSCITNIGLITGVVAIIMPIEFDRADVLKRSAWMVLGAVLIVFFSWDLTMSRTYAAALLFFAAVYLAWDVVGVIRSRADMNDRTADDNPKILNAVGRFVLGAVFVTFGSWLLVETGQDIAKFIGVSSEVIGLSVVAFGTSVPEFVTGVTAARRGMSDLSLGNIIGANVLNLLLIVGASGAITPLVLKPVSQQYAFLWLGLFFAVLLGVVIRHGVIRRAAGIGLLVLFSLYMLGLFV